MKSKENFVPQVLKEDGHLYVYLEKDGIVTEHRVCNLMWEAFKGKIPKGYEVAHANGIRTDNRLDNLMLIKKG